MNIICLVYLRQQDILGRLMILRGNRKSIQLLCGINKFEAPLLMDVTGRKRIAWRSDFRDFLLNKYPYWKDFEQFKFPLLCFRNMSESQYEVSFEMNKF